MLAIVMPSCVAAMYGSGSLTARRSAWKRLGFPIREEMLIDEVVDDRLMRGVDLLELNAHADAAVAPRDVPFRLDVALRPRHAEPDLDFRPRFERARRADRNPAVAQIQRQRRG